MLTFVYDKLRISILVAPPPVFLPSVPFQLEYAMKRENKWFFNILALDSIHIET
jgi:hypothetical protein